jgi:predicted house-cleaning noncanonical NTP pyrophosphatase (MazG superfamily)
MLKFKFEKLVRDKIAEQQITAGSKPNLRTLDREEHKKELVKKIFEEAGEILTAHPEDTAGEIADVQQVLDDLKVLLGISDEEVAKAQEAKNKKNGSFKEGIYIESVEVNENDQWVAYYRKNSERYPEIT